MGQYASCPALGLDETDTGLMRLYPNPSNGVIRVSFSDIEEGFYVVELYNLIGQQVNLKNEFISGYGELTLDYSSEAAGQYILKLKNASGNFSRSFQLVLK